jgi:pimeloyl-ACP methyl ester carboxylesterase
MPHPAHRGDAALRLDVGIERPWVVRGGAGELSGVICEPEAGIVPGQSWTIFYNAGGVRRSGPNRLWTAAARALARDGRPSLRIDVRDVGDSDGTDEPYGHLEAMYAEASIDDAVRAYDWAVARGASSIDVVGLCSGAFMGIQVAARRPVRRALLFNGLAFVWDARARGASVARHVRASLFDLERWKLLLTGRIDLRAVSSALLQRTLASASGVLRRAHGAARIDPVDAILRRVAAAGTELRLVCSENDPSIEYLSRHTAPEHRPDVTTIAAADHTIRPLRAHPRVVALVTGRE